MCDTALSFARDHLLPLARDHLLPVLTEAANILRGVQKDVEELKDELEIIEKFINDADRIADVEEDNTRYGIRTKITKLIEASFLIEDIIDEYINIEEQQPWCACGELVRTMTLRLQIAYKIHNITSRIRKMKDKSGGDHAFQIQFPSEGGPTGSAANQKATNLRDAPLYMDGADVVGFAAPKDKLIDWLLMGRAELTVVSVVAMGGQGKTTLAKIVFDSTKVTQHFVDCRVWITVSESYTVEVLLRSLLQEFYKQERRDPPPELFEMDQPSLRHKVKDYLKHKRYVIVFDDVWNILFWDDIEFCLVDNNNGSRILITTRNIEVVMSCRKSSFVEVHELQPLTSEKSFQLFTKKAFHDLNGCCPNKILNISYDIVDKCNGLPLAIVVIGGILSQKDRNAIEWQGFSKNLSLALKKHSHLSQIKKILGFSYHDLPCNLKPCLLYFGLYPEDYVVDSKSLIRQWIAEGFVKEELGKTLEEVAEGYLRELIHRSLVQISSISIDGRVKSCQVHDLLHVMILEKSEELRFCNNISKNDQSPLSGIIRRLSVTTNSINLVESIESSHVRSLLFLTRKTLPQSFVQKIPTKYKLLKVLDFCRLDALEVPTKLPTNFGNLIYLKYLSLRCLLTENGMLLKSIGMLQNLETLDLRGAYFLELSKEICKLKRLRHLASNANCWMQLKDGIGSMTSLQTLGEVKLLGFRNTDEEKVVFIEELGKLKQLRELFLIGLPVPHETSLSSSINEMQHLEKLKVISIRVSIRLHLISPSPMLRSLTLDGELPDFPEWIPQLENLVKLKLRNSFLTDDPLKSLKSMSNLLSLSITKFAYEGESLHFEKGGCENLKELYIEDSHKLNSIVIDEGALNSLKKLQLGCLFQLKKIPTGIQHLNMLEVLIIGPMSKEFEKDIALTEGKANQIMDHVPHLEFQIRNEGFIRGSSY